MNKQLSAMQELIEHLSYFSIHKDMIDNITAKAERLLEKEKQQIIESYNTGKGHEQFGVLDEISASGNDYYNNTFNQPKT